LTLRRENALQTQSLQTQIRTLEAAAVHGVSAGGLGSSGVFGTRSLSGALPTNPAVAAPSGMQQQSGAPQSPYGGMRPAPARPY